MKWLIPLLLTLSGCAALRDQDDKVFDVSFKVTPTENGCVVEWEGREELIRGTKEIKVNR